MPLYRHDGSGEQVDTPQDSPEGLRLSGDPAWTVVDAPATEHEQQDEVPPVRPRKRRQPAEDTEDEPAPVLDLDEPTADDA